MYRVERVTNYISLYTIGFLIHYYTLKNLPVCIAIHSYTNACNGVLHLLGIEIQMGRV